MDEVGGAVYRINNECRGTSQGGLAGDIGFLADELDVGEALVECMCDERFDSTVGFSNEVNG